MAKKVQFRSIRMKTFATILPAFLVTLLLVALFSYDYSKTIIQNQIQEKMKVQLSDISNGISANLSTHRKVPEVLARVVENQASAYTLEQYRAMLSNALNSNKDTYGVGIYFEPERYSANQKFFSTYAYREGGNIVTTEQYSDPSYNYPAQAWYKIGKEQIGITDPYYDTGTDTTMATFSVPFFDSQRTLLGVMTGDINLQTLQDEIAKTKVGDAGWAMLIDKQGNYIAGPDKEKIMKLKISGEKNASLASAGKELLQKSSGMVKYSDAKTPYQLYYQKLPETGWVLGLTISEKELYAPLKSLLNTIVLTGLAGLVVIVLAVYFYSRFITRKIGMVNELSHLMADGDFTRRLDIQSSDEFGTMAQYMNRMIENLSKLLGQAADHSFQVASTSEQLMSSANQTNQTTEAVVQAIQDMAAGADTQLQATRESARAMEEMAAGVQRIAESSTDAAEAAGKVANQAQSGNDIITQAVGGMKVMEMSVAETMGLIESLDARSGQIGEIIGLITEISNQTNMLALNAAIEAARAGEYGRGFSVVAGEVKKLSEQTAQAASHISSLISEIQQENLKAVDSMTANAGQVQEGSRMVSEAGQLFTEIMHGIGEIHTQIHEVSSSSEQLLAGTEELTSTVEQMAEIANHAVGHSQSVAASSEEQLASMEEVAAASMQLAKMADDMQSSVTQFKVSQV
ncbi:methyl-accepting chemotaxis protein [Paenibacillus sp. HW567]|uniref:methyl-accepting chemotaxis protein n=1 Tax=Paenibacillus sp. HW567 TaxID=1034769 RepID=UPI0003713312|nr:methyl-accepting chemotaxis protein [Paenibacillus sp. HW567]